MDHPIAAGKISSTRRNPDFERTAWDYLMLPAHLGAARREGASAATLKRHAAPWSARVAHDLLDGSSVLGARKNVGICFFQSSPAIS
jgi:hypothetical protein